MVRRPTVCIAESLQGGRRWQGELAAYREVALDPISDDYTVDEISADGLFRKWERAVRVKYPNGLVPIYWQVKCEECGIFETMPFQFAHFPLHEDFLTFHTWPTSIETGERLNWLALPVVDKLWNARRSDKGGGSSRKQQIGSLPCFSRSFISWLSQTVVSDHSGLGQSRLMPRLLPKPRFSLYRNINGRICRYMSEQATDCE